MRKTVLFVSILMLLLVSCKKTYIPVAVFHVDTITPEVGQSVIFYNESRDAVNFEWDFGDGYTSTDANPIHTFDATGSYEVKLTAISKSNLEDNASLSLTVTVPTLLEVQVLEYFDQYVVPNASIIIYPTLGDWDSQTNKITEGFTDQYGIAVFSGLSNRDYYLDVWEQDHDNYALRAEDSEFIHVSEVVPHVINRFTAYVDYVQHLSATGRKSSAMVLKKLERRVTDRVQPPYDATQENWEALYKRSIRLK
jgi:PKD repeat protein